MAKIIAYFAQRRPRKAPITTIMPAKRQSSPAAADAPTASGTVIKSTGSAYLVRLDNAPAEPVPCRVKGNFRIRGLRTTNPVAVGDRVDVALTGTDAHFITRVHPRSNYIIRRASNLSKESHILAANLTGTLLVASLRNPTTTTTFIDRFLATAEAYSVPPTLVLNKEDSWNDDDRELAEAIHYLYTSIGYPVVFTSATTGFGIAELRERLTGGITLLAGNSGVGKSSLINALVPGAGLRTGAISDIHHTGTHTTTFSEMIPLPGGGALIDVPGVKGFGTIDFDPDEVSHFFPEIFRTGADCRYGNCRHTGEPGCAVADALDQQRIAASRYASYLSILEEATGSDKYRKPF